MLVKLSELENNEEGDFFALLSAKEALTTKDGKPYYRVAFRDAEREVSFPVWNDVPLADACRDEWEVGEFYKLRAKFRETTFGPQLEIRKIRPVNAKDKQEGFDPAMCLPRSRVDPEELFDSLVDIVEEHVDDEPLAALTLAILNDHRETLLRLPAATRNHHAYAGGFLEHVLSVTKTCVHFAKKYAEMFPDLLPPLDTDLVITGGVLHDIGKLRELRATPIGAEYTPEGTLIGHMLQGRDILREAAQVQAEEGEALDAEKLLRLEHIIVAHQRLPEWGAPKPPMTPEALLVHYADDTDAKIQMMVSVLEEDTTSGPFTSNRNLLRQSLYRGEQLESE